jgi:hypothetical protein
MESELERLREQFASKSLEELEAHLRERTGDRQQEHDRLKAFIDSLSDDDPRLEAAVQQFHQSDDEDWLESAALRMAIQGARAERLASQPPPKRTEYIYKGWTVESYSTGPTTVSYEPTAKEWRQFAKLIDLRDHRGRLIPRSTLEAIFSTKEEAESAIDEGRIFKLLDAADAPEPHWLQGGAPGLGKRHRGGRH